MWLQRGFVIVSVLLCLSVGLGLCRLGRVPNRNTLNYHTLYQREAKPYANVKFDKTLPYVPRYRYPISSYVGKRNMEDDSVEDIQNSRSFAYILKALRDYLSNGEESSEIY